MEFAEVEPAEAGRKSGAGEGAGGRGESGGLENSPDQLAEIDRLVESEKLKVRVATVLPLAEVKKAHRLSADGHAEGKIILRP